MLFELWSTGLSPLLAALLVSLAVAGLLVLSRNWHLRHTGDHEHYLPQKIHVGAVPRVGGMAIALGVIAGGLVALDGLGNLVIGPQALGLLLGAVPVLVIGLAEDIFKHLRPRYRLLAAALGAGIAIQYASIALLRTEVPAIDAVFTLYGVALGFTVFALVGATNAFNVIDGLNGLLGGVTLITMAGIAVVASQVGDFKVEMLASIVAAATLGFLPFNWPRARLFAGDGGAYFLGFVTAALLLLLVSRHAQISPWFGLTAAALPLCETLHSILRRWRKKLAATEPDIGHLHQLLREWALRGRALRALKRYRMLRSVPGFDRRSSWQGFRLPNGSVSPLLWCLHGAAVILGAIWYQSTPTQMMVLVAFALTYRWIYARMARFGRFRSLVRYDALTGAIVGIRKWPNVAAAAIPAAHPAPVAAVPPSAVVWPRPRAPLGQRVAPESPAVSAATLAAPPPPAPEWTAQEPAPEKIAS